MAINTKQVLRHHVKQAAKVWKQQPGYAGFRDSTRYDVLIDGEPYPPKAIVAISNEIAGFPPMLPADFAGAKDGKWHTMLKDLDFRIVPKGVEATETSEIGRAASIDEDIQAIEDNPHVSLTDKATFIMARLGQGKYRRELLSLWGNRCAVTGITVSQVLRASHAKPWRDSDDKERLDPNNGLPLVANLDALFDAGLIGFDADGQMHVSNELNDRGILTGIPRKLRHKPTPRQAPYLMEHLDSVFKGALTAPILF